MLRLSLFLLFLSVSPVSSFLRAFEWLNGAYQTRDAGLNELKGDPLLKSLVHDPRYAALFQKMRLPL